MDPNSAGSPSPGYIYIQKGYSHKDTAWPVSSMHCHPVLLMMNWKPVNSPLRIDRAKQRFTHIQKIYEAGEENEVYSKY